MGRVEDTVVNVNLNVNEQYVDNGAKEKLDNLSAALQTVAALTKEKIDMKNYFGTADQAINRVTNAISKYEAVISDVNAKELINSVNALKAIDPSFDFSRFGAGFDDLIKKASELSAGMEGVFTATEFAPVFRAFSSLKSQLADFDGFMDKIAAALDQTPLLNQLKEQKVEIDEITSKLGQSRLEAEKYRKELEQIKTADYSDILRQLDEYIAKCERISQMQVNQFASELYQGGAINYNQLSDLRRGRELSAITDTGDYFTAADAINNLVQRIKDGDIEVSRAVTSMRQSFGELFSNRILGAGAEEATQNLENVEVGIRNVGQATNNINAGNVSELFSSVGGLGDIKVDQFQGFVNALNELNGIDAYRIIVPIQRMFDTLQKGDIAVSEGSIEKFKNALSGLIESLDAGKLSALSALNFDGLKGLKSNKSLTELANNLVPLSKNINIEKLKTLADLNFGKFSESISQLKINQSQITSLKTMLDYLPKISNEVNIDNLKALSKIKFTNFTKEGGFNISKSQMEGLAALTNKSDISSVITQLEQLGSKLDEIFDKMNSGGGGGGKKVAFATIDVDSVRQKLESLSATYESLTIKMNGVNDKELNKNVLALGSSLNKLWDDVANGDMEMDKFAKSAEVLTKDLANASKEVQNFKGAENIENSLKPLEQLPEKLAPATKSLNAFEKQINDALNQFSKGKGTEAYKGIQDLAKEVEEYRQKMGQVTKSDFDTWLSKQKVKFDDLTRSLKSSGIEAQSFGAKIGSAVQQYAKMFTGTMAVMRVVQGFKQAVSATVELDSAMTQLKIVTKATDSELDAYSDTILKTADNTASAVTDVVDAMTTYARLGFSLSDSNILADLTAQLQNVGRRYCLAA